MIVDLRIGGRHASAVHRHLYPGDELEAVAFALCGRHEADSRTVLLVQDVVPIAYDDCKRYRDSVSWNTDRLVDVFERARASDLSVVKLHSHPTGWPEFSELDDESDRKVLASAFDWIDGATIHGSVIVLPDGQLVGRAFHGSGRSVPMRRLTVAGDDLRIYGDPTVRDADARRQRLAQAFGTGTTDLLRELTAVVIGCSGTGTPLAEALVRLGIGRIVLIDPKAVRDVNLSRLLNVFAADVGKPKVDVLKAVIPHMGYDTEVVAIAEDLASDTAVRAAAGGDVLFGCVDSAKGRHVASRLASHYLLPYFDVGVQIIADGTGGVNQVYRALNYIQPGGSSLLSRGVYTTEELRAESLAVNDPDAYAEQRERGYLVNVAEDRPAVIALNMAASGDAVMDFLARVHPYRALNNAAYAYQGFSYVNMAAYEEPDGEACPVMGKLVGQGDTEPLLGMPTIHAPLDGEDA